MYTVEQVGEKHVHQQNGQDREERHVQYRKARTEQEERNLRNPYKSVDFLTVRKNFCKKGLSRALYKDGLEQYERMIQSSMKGWSRAV